MTKAEALIQLANRQERLATELEAMTNNMGLADGHEAMIAVSNMGMTARQIHRLARRPSLTTELTFKEPI